MLMDHPRGPADPIRSDDAAAMVRAAESSSDPRGVRDAALIALSAQLMLRSAELLALDGRDVRRLGSRLAGARVRIQRSKTDERPVMLPISADVLARIDLMLAARGVSPDADAPLFTIHGGRRMGWWAANAAVARWAAAVDLSGRFSVHSLRRGIATSRLEAGQSTAAVQLAGRWRDPSMVARYAAEADTGIWSLDLGAPSTGDEA